MENPPTCIRAPMCIRPNEADNGTRYCKKAAVHHPRGGGDGGLAAYAAGIAPSADGALERWGISRRARRGNFARCGGRPESLPLDSAIWAARHPLARVVAEEFCVRARCGFAAILDVWQEAAPPPWRKRPGERRRHTGGGQPSQEKNRVKLLIYSTLPEDFGECPEEQHRCHRCRNDIGQRLREERCLRRHQHRQRHQRHQIDRFPEQRAE